MNSYATKTDLKNLTYVDVSSFASKANLASLKTEVDKIDVDKLKALSVDLAKLSYENKIPDASGLVKKTDFNTKVTEIEGKIPSISSLATNSALTAV